MPRYTHAELNRTALDAVTEATPTGAVEALQYRVDTILADQDFPETAWAQIEAAFGAAFDALDRIEQEVGQR